MDSGCPLPNDRFPLRLRFSSINQSFIRIMWMGVMLHAWFKASTEENPSKR